MRAREPDRAGYAVRSGVRLYYEVHGDGPTTVLLLQTWSIVHSRIWKLQVPYLARHARVVVYDGRGNGRSDRPSGAAAYDDAELVADALAVLDQVGVDRAVVVGLSLGGRILLALAAAHPDRVSGGVFVGPSVDLEDGRDEERAEFFVERDAYVGWDRWNANYWRQDLAGFAEFFFGEVFPEPHSTRQVEDAVSWALDTDGETLVATKSLPPSIGAREARAAAAAVRCPTLVIHGVNDPVVPLASGRALSEALGCPLDTVIGGGHCVQARHPVWFNLRLRRFVEQVAD